MTRLPIIGGDDVAWGNVLNDYLTQSASLAVLSNSPTSGSSSFDVTTALPTLRTGVVVAVDVFTTQCELRSVSGLSGSTITVDTAFKYNHTSGDRMIVLSDFVSAEFYGLTGDGTDEWGPLQRLIKEATAYGALTIRGGGATFSVQQPLLVATGSRVDRLTVQSRTGFAPADGTAGAMVSVGSRNQNFTATASDNTITTASAHSATAGDIIAFNAPYGETLPGSIVAGRWYYVKTTPTASTMTISATNGGAEFDITSDGAGWAVYNIADLTRVFWESVRLNLTIADLSGLVVGPQQPSWTRNLRVEMDAAASTQGSAVGAAIGGQLSYHDNIEINTSQNCTGLVLSGTGISVRGFNCNGVNSTDTGIVVSGSRHAIGDIWTEQCGRAGVEIVTSLKGCQFDGYWLQSSSSPTTAPVLLVSTSTSTYVWNAMLRCASSTQLILNDTARSISLSGAGEMDANLVFHGMRQQTGAVGPVLNFRGWAFIDNTSSPFTPSRLQSFVKADASAGDITVNLPTAVGWLGQLYTIKHSGTGNTVTIDPNGAQTVDGASTLTLKARQAVTVMSDGANWHVMDQKLAGSATTYTPTNVSTDRAYDANATTTDELADVLGTLIGDLQARGIIA